ncbi:MAG TPA: glucosidase, partial [Verrucomicrobiae bacterium]|nr:glucosidase [Verrucomicrobiae bacterium]
MNPEQARLQENNTPDEPWYFWGPYLAERAWGTVREDYSANGDAWGYFPHDHARSRAYRWNEDGIGGISDHKGRLCFAFGFWNERDSILKERLFGVSGPQGNHGEDVKEVYWYIDNVPSHSLMRMIYRYPQQAFPYDELVARSGSRSKMEGEFEIWDTGVVAENRYFDIEIEYAKVDPYDILIRATATNHGPETANLHLLPTIWFRNTWSWGRHNQKPGLRALGQTEAHIDIIETAHQVLGSYRLFCEGADDLLFTENETNAERLWATPNRTPFVKDSINDFFVRGKTDSINPQRVGTKAAAHYKFTVPPGEHVSVRLRLKRVDLHRDDGEPFADFDKIFTQREEEANLFYEQLAPASLGKEHRAI